MSEVLGPDSDRQAREADAAAVADRSRGAGVARRALADARSFVETASHLLSEPAGLWQQAEQHTVGYAAAGWRTVTNHLQGLGYIEEHFLDAGVAKYTRDGRLIDRFRERVLVGSHDRHGL